MRYFFAQNFFWSNWRAHLRGKAINLANTDLMIKKTISHTYLLLRNENSRRNYKYVIWWSVPASKLITNYIQLAIYHSVSMRWWWLEMISSLGWWMLHGCFGHSGWCWSNFTNRWAELEYSCDLWDIMICRNKGQYR